MFIGFTNFYRHFIQGFSRIAASLTSLLKTTGLSKSALKVFKTDDDKIVGSRDGRTNGIVVNLSKNKKSRNLTYVLNIGLIEESNFLILDAIKAFNHLRLAFIKILILRYFDLKSHIQIKIDVSGYTIDEVLSQLKFDSNRLRNNSNLNKSDFD